MGGEVQQLVVLEFNVFSGTQWNTSGCIMVGGSVPISTMFSIAETSIRC